MPAVRQLVEDGFRVDVVFWNHASQQLKEACSQFVELNTYVDHLAYQQT